MIEPTVEWRVVFHFDLSTVPSSYSKVTLQVPLHGLDPGAPDGELCLVVYDDDGTVSLDEFDCSVVHTTFSALTGEFPSLTLDVTTLVTTYLAAGHTHLAFRLQAGATTDRYEVGATGGVTEPYLVVEP